MLKFLHNLGTGSSLPKTTLRAKIIGSWLGEHVKIRDSLFISATVEASNFKFGIQLGFGEELAKKKNFYDQNWRGSGLGEHPKNVGPPIYFCSR